jgi:CBS domain-containing protein
MNAHNIGCLLVTDNNDKLMGIFTEADVLMRVVGQVDDLAESTVADYMTADPIVLTSNLPIAHALHVMSLHGFRHLPLVDAHNRPEGIISFRDVVRYIKNHISE